MAYGVAQEKSLTLKYAPTQALIGRAILIGRLGRARKPTLVDAAAIETVGIIIGRVQAQPFAGVQETARHPRRRETQHAFASVEGFVQNVGEVLGFRKTG